MLKRAFSGVDWFLLIPTVFLSIIGLVILFSINLKSQKLLVDFNVWSQVLFMGIGAIVAFAFARIDYQLWRTASGWFYLAGMALLSVVLFVDPVQGSSRWISLGIFQFQPSEIMKLALIVMLARLFAKRHKTINRPWSLLLSVVYASLPMALVFFQPDLGTAVVFGMIWLTMISMTEIKKYFLIALIASVALAIPIAYQYLAPYQQDRIDTFINPENDPQGAGYNVLQATIAIGSGGLLGNGLDAGSQSQLNFLPAQHTDFIFAVIAEKLGFIGAMLVIGALLMIIIRAVLIGWRSSDQFGMQLAVGIATVMGFHSIVNIGMNLSLLPVTGIPLPLLSYGGTHVIMGLASIGILHSISASQKGLHF